MSDQQYVEFGKLVFDKMSSLEENTSNVHNMGEFTIEAMHTIEDIALIYKDFKEK